MKRVNVHIYPSPFKNESRILKITKTLAEANVFDKIYIMATWEVGLPETEILDNTREVIRIRRKISEAKSGTFWKALKTFEWSWRLIKALQNKKIDCINCHSLPMLPLCVFLKFIKHAELIYDTHELETETAESKGIRKHFLKFTEKILMPFVNETIVVSDSIAEWYRKKYRIMKVWVVKNIPYRFEGTLVKTNILRSAFAIKEGHVLFLYQGAISKERGIELLLKIFSNVSEEKHLVFMGFGDMVKTVETYSKQYLNIHYHPAVKPEDVIQYTCSADIGIHLIENTCLNHYYCLPNKIWEYLNAEIPVIVSDLPEMGRVVEQYNCGWKCTPTVEDAARLIEQITFNALSEKRNGAIEARKHFGWHLEEPTLLNVYKRLGF